MVGGETEEKCKVNLFTVLEKLNKHNAKFNVNKSEFMQRKIDYLGYTLSAEGITAIDGVGAVLSHTVNGIERPVAFASATLTEAQKNYEQVHKEALAIMFGMEKIHKYVLGYHFKLLTDNSGVNEISNPHRGTSSIAMARLQRWALKLIIYDYEIEHRPGKMMAHVDAFSRLPLAFEHAKIDGVSLKGFGMCYQ